MSSEVLDSSSVLALLNQEAGQESVEEALAEGAIFGSVNLAEVVARLGEAGMSEEGIRARLQALKLEVVPFDADLAFRTGLLRMATRSAGLSLGDRACLALARRLNLPVLTADRAWMQVSVGVTIHMIR